MRGLDQVRTKVQKEVLIPLHNYLVVGVIVAARLLLIPLGCCRPSSSARGRAPFQQQRRAPHTFIPHVCDVMQDPPTC